LSQVISELKSTAYNPKTVILASRDHSCINPDLSEFKGHNLQNKCNKAVKSHKCEYFQDYAKRVDQVPYEPYDIEDLHKIGKSNKICPFYLNKDRSATADLILMSYNYMLYESMRPNNNLNFENSIIIFDEAHNVPKCAEDSASFQLDTDSML
jgi:regulator of telomere elongation helicase 1